MKFTFPFFKKKSEEHPSKSGWAILQGEENGKPMIVRRNNSAKQFASNSEYIYRVGVAIPLLEPNEVGFPSPEEMKSLNQIEDELSQQLEKDKISIQVLAITTDGMREFVYYTCDSKIVKQVIYNVRSKFSSHEIQFYVKEDKEWSIYKEFA
jgi:hypothetical protein